MSIEFFLGAVGFYVLVLGYYLVRAFRKEKGRVKFELKKAANGWRFPIHVLWTMYFIIWGVYQIPGVNNWSVAQIVAHPEYGPDTLTYYVYAAPPYIAIITILAVAWWVMSLSAKPWIKYSGQEQEWLKEEKDKFREKARKWFGKRVGEFLVR